MIQVPVPVGAALVAVAVLGMCAGGIATARETLVRHRPRHRLRTDRGRP